jgi:hypothetical protein
MAGWIVFLCVCVLPRGSCESEKCGKFWPSVTPSSPLRLPLRLFLSLSLSEERETESTGLRFAWFVVKAENSGKLSLGIPYFTDSYRRHESVGTTALTPQKK